jgi:hypothetical protein
LLIRNIIFRSLTPNLSQIQSDVQTFIFRNPDTPYLLTLHSQKLANLLPYLLISNFYTKSLFYRSPITPYLQRFHTMNSFFSILLALFVMFIFTDRSLVADAKVSHLPEHCGDGVYAVMRKFFQKSQSFGIFSSKVTFLAIFFKKLHFSDFLQKVRLLTVFSQKLQFISVLPQKVTIY